MNDAKLPQCRQGKIAAYNGQKHRQMGGRILWLNVVAFMKQT